MCLFTLATNSGIIASNLQGTCLGHGLVWFHPEAITNILSQSKVEDKGQNVTHQCGSCKVSGPNSHAFFKHIPEGLCTLNLNDLNNQINNIQVALVWTIARNKEGFAKHQIQQAEQALRLQEMIVFLSIADFKNAIQMNAIKNCPITIEDINISLEIHGTNIPSLKGKSTCRKPPQAINNCIKLPPELQANDKHIELSADIFCIQGLTFLLTLSENIEFYNIGCITNQTVTSLCKCFDATFGLCNSATFTVTHLHVDPEFEPLTKFMQENHITVIPHPVSVLSEIASALFAMHFLVAASQDCDQSLSQPNRQVHQHVPNQEHHLQTLQLVSENVKVLSHWIHWV